MSKLFFRKPLNIVDKELYIMKIYGDDYTCLLDDKKRVIWGYGEIPFDEYRPHPLLKYYSHKGLSWFSIVQEFYSDDLKGRGKPVILTIEEYLGS